MEKRKSNPNHKKTKAVKTEGGREGISKSNPPH